MPAGTPMTLRLRTFHDDVTSVRARVFDVNANAQQLIGRCGSRPRRLLLPGRRSQPDVRLLAGRAPERAGEQPLVPLHRLGRRRHGVLRRRHGRARRRPRRDQRRHRDWSYALTVYDPGFRDAGVGEGRGRLPDLPRPLPQRRHEERPAGGTIRYDQPATTKAVERRCPRATAATTRTPEPCGGGPDRAATTSAATSRASASSSSSCRRSASTRSTSTRSSGRSRTTATTPPTTRRSTRTSATQKEFDQLVKQAHERRCTSSSTASSTTCRPTRRSSTATTTSRPIGACESTASPYRSWFVFMNAHVPCSVRRLLGLVRLRLDPGAREVEPGRHDYFVGARTSSRLWLKRGADGWRIDVSGRRSFPAGYWEAFRQVVKAADPTR